MQNTKYQALWVKKTIHGLCEHAEVNSGIKLVYTAQTVYSLHIYLKSIKSLTIFDTLIKKFNKRILPSIQFLGDTVPRPTI